MVKNNLIILILAVILCGCSKTHEETPVNDLACRVLGDEASSFIFEDIFSDDGLDVFEIDSKGEKIVIRGNNELAKASGLNYYLENFCNCQISINYNQLNLPDKLPLPDKPVRVNTPFEYRYFFNYCTFGYTMPWWNFERWEKMIDYMALKGVNMPLAIIGQEAVWSEVYKELGLDSDDLDNFFVGPAHLPWGWMGNIDGLAGPLPNTWIEKRKELQVKILKRQRELGMKPVLQAFTGHVPMKLKEIYPNAKIMQINSWAGVSGTWFLDPSDPLFSKIGSLFIKKQTEMYGTDHLYDADCFIEVDPPSKDPEFLENTSRSIYESMASVDPEAKWVLQGWFFFFRKEFWQKEQGEAFFKGIPQNKAIVLDLYGEKNPTWDKTDAFFGQPWIWNVICNEDQKVNMSGDLVEMQNQFLRAYKSEKDNNLRGIGVIPEGFGYNMIVQDFIFGKAWNQDSTDVENWVKDYAVRRYGINSDKAKKAWELLLKSVYSRTRTMWSPLITTPQLVKFSGEEEDIRHNRVSFRITEEDPFAWDFNVNNLAQSARLLLEASSELKNVPTYQFDLTNVFRELLHSLTHKYIDAISVAYERKDKKALDVAGNNLLKLFDDLDEITSCNENFMLGKWLSDAMKWGDNDKERDFYNTNARTIITIWQPWENATLRDYSGRMWNGLLKDYYKPRWELLLSYLRQSIDKNMPYDRDDYFREMKKMDYQWTLKNNVYPDKPLNNIIEVANRVWNEYVVFHNKG